MGVADFSLIDRGLADGSAVFMEASLSDLIRKGAKIAVDKHLQAVKLSNMRTGVTESYYAEFSSVH